MGRVSFRRIASLLGFLPVLAHAGLALAETPPIVFVSRTYGRAPDATSRPRAIELAHSGKLVVRELDGRTRILVDAAAAVLAGAPVDVMDPDVSFDGTRIVFAGYSADERAWRIFEVGTDGSGFRQLTRSNRQVDLSRFGPAAASLLEDYDDVDPCYLPDGRICFVSTRYPGIAPDSRRRSTNLYVMNADGSSLHRITTERYGADTPTVEPSTGLIVYSRWWRSTPIEEGTVPPDEYERLFVSESPSVLRGVEDSDFRGVNNWFLSSIRPDGTELTMYSGFRLDRLRTQAYRPSFQSDGSALVLFIPETPFIGYPRGNGLRRLLEGHAPPTFLGGPQTFPPAGVPGPIISQVYASAAGLADGRILVTAARPGMPAGGYGVYIQTGLEPPVLLLDEPGAAELDAMPLVPRVVPPVLADSVTDLLLEDVPRNKDEAFAQGGSFTFLAENIHSNAPVDVAMPHAPPIGKNLSIEFFMNPQRMSPLALDRPILIQRLKIPPSGKVEVSLPAGVPLFEVLRQGDGSIAQGRDGQIFHVGGFNFGRAGQTNRCVGCHAGHSRLEVPEDPAWTNVAPSADVAASTVLPATDDPLLHAVRLVDRQTDPGRDWVGQMETTSRINLTWTTTIRARELIIYATRRKPGMTQEIEAIRATVSLEGRMFHDIPITVPISPDGTHVAMDPDLEFDALALTISGGAEPGRFLGFSGPALAEVEVIGKAVRESQPMFVRGEANCDGQINLSDAVVVLSHLFRGGPKPCCSAAADSNGDNVVDISDPIFSLNFLFLGMAVLPQPFPSCGSGSTLDCETEICL